MTHFPTVQAPTEVPNPENVSDFDAKHVPHIDIEVTDDIAYVTVTPGYYVTHPNTVEHFFEWLMITVEDQPIAHFVATPEVINPIMTVQVNLEPGTVIEAMAHCNLHGTFLARKEIPICKKDGVCEDTR